jgi:hypothetical protein
VLGGVSACRNCTTSTTTDNDNDKKEEEEEEEGKLFEENCKTPTM